MIKKVADKVVIALPSCMYTDIICKVHENGHFGLMKITESIKENFCIPRLKEKLEKFISRCIPCILAERKKGKMKDELMPIPKDVLLLTYHVDLSSITSTSKMYKYLFVVMDEFSKFVSKAVRLHTRSRC